MEFHWSSVLSSKDTETNFPLSRAVGPSSLWYRVNMDMNTSDYLCTPKLLVANSVAVAILFVVLSCSLYQLKQMLGLTFLSIGGLFFGGTFLYLVCGHFYLTCCRITPYRLVFPQPDSSDSPAPFNDIRDQD